VTVADSFAPAVEWMAEICREAGLRRAAEGRRRGVADGGGYRPDFQSNEAALDTVERAVKHAGFPPGEQLGIVPDVAASTYGPGDRFARGG